MIPFNVPPYTGREDKYLKEAISKNRKICGDGPFTKKVNAFLENRFCANKALLTTSGTHALDMSAILLDIRPGDEVIAPSYTFVSTVNAFALRGATIVFVDIRPDTINIDENLIESAITERTKVIIPVHYAGISCEMDRIMEIAKRHNLIVVEDAAQGVMSKYKGKSLGTIGNLGCYSFHETKNYSMGEGGAILINDCAYTERAEIIREKGTDRTKAIINHVDKYTWVDIGSSYLPSDINAAYLYGQLEIIDEINSFRLHLWNKYYEDLSPLEKADKIELPFVPEECTHNAHMFYIKTKDIKERSELTRYLKEREIITMAHYLPLHSAKAGLKYGRFHGEDKYTTKESERLLRLPLYYGLEDSEVDQVISVINKFYC